MVALHFATYEQNVSANSGANLEQNHIIVKELAPCFEYPII